MIISETLKVGRSMLQTGDYKSRQTDTAAILCFVLGCGREYLFAHDTDEIELEAKERFLKFVRLRAEGLPVQYITGHQEFMSLDFEVNASVLIPRADTEILVEEVIRRVEAGSSRVDSIRAYSTKMDSAKMDSAKTDSARADRAQKDSAKMDSAKMDSAKTDSARADSAQTETRIFEGTGLKTKADENSDKKAETGTQEVKAQELQAQELEGARLKTEDSLYSGTLEGYKNIPECVKKTVRILDIGTGSGCIAVSLAHYLPECKVTAVDVSPAALEVAKSNAVKNNVAQKVEFIESDIFSSLDGRIFDVIVSNPPYIRKDEFSSLQTEVAEFEPRGALDGGDDGLDFYRSICAQAPAHLTDGGLLVFEVGAEQAQSVAGIMAKNLEKNFEEIHVVKDLSGIERVVCGRI